MHNRRRRHYEVTMDWNDGLVEAHLFSLLQKSVCFGNDDSVVDQLFLNVMHMVYDINYSGNNSEGW